MTLQQIKTEVEKATGLNISTDTRKREYVIARGMYFDLAYRFTTKSYEKIGREVGRNHATVLHSMETFKNHLAYEEDAANTYEILNQYFRDRLKTYCDEKQQLEDWVNSIPEKKYSKVLKQLELIKL